MTSLTWIKRITGIGLSLMSPDAQRERIRCNTYTYASSPPRATISLYFREMVVRAEQVRIKDCL